MIHSTFRDSMAVHQQLIENPTGVQILLLFQYPFLPYLIVFQCVYPTIFRELLRTFGNLGLTLN